MKPQAPFKYQETYALLENLMQCQWVPFGNYVSKISPAKVDINKFLNEEEQ